MKKSIRFIICVLAASLVLSACGPTASSEPSVHPFYFQVQLQDTGLFGNHDLTTPVEKSEALHGSFNGVYFLFAGGVEGQISSTTILTFRWSPLPGKFKTSEIPRSKFETNIDNSVVTPYIVFIFKEEWLNSCFVPTTNILSCDLMTLSDKANLNTFVESENLVSVQVYISETDRAKEPLLP